jgi:hypothetical protein
LRSSMDKGLILRMICDVQSSAASKGADTKVQIKLKCEETKI